MARVATRDVNERFFETRNGTCLELTMETTKAFNAVPDLIVRNSVQHRMTELPAELFATRNFGKRSF